MISGPQVITYFGKLGKSLNIPYIILLTRSSFPNVCSLIFGRIAERAERASAIVLYFPFSSYNMLDKNDIA